MWKNNYDTGSEWMCWVEKLGSIMYIIFNIVDMEGEL